MQRMTRTSDWIVVGSTLHIAREGKCHSKLNESDMYLWFTGFKSLKDKGKQRFPLSRLSPPDTAIPI